MHIEISPERGRLKTSTPDGYYLKGDDYYEVAGGELESRYPKFLVYPQLVGIEPIEFDGFRIEAGVETQLIWSKSSKDQRLCFERRSGIWVDCMTMVDIEEANLKGFVELDGGRQWLYNDHGKYAPKVTFVGLKTPFMPTYKKVAAAEFNLERGDISALEGRFFVSKKGTKCFEIEAGGPHQLVKDSWGGCFNNYRGGQLGKLKSLYEIRRCSNGGGAGCDYAIVAKGERYQLSVDDI